MSIAPRLRAHYVLSTHWDREWYQSFQNYPLSTGAAAGPGHWPGWRTGGCVGPFQTDGQAIILEDYLEIRPDRRPQLERLAQAGQLVIGPWYVLPDEFLVSGESLIRNIRHGREHRAQLWRRPRPSRLRVRPLRPQQPDAADLCRLWHSRRVDLARAESPDDAPRALAGADGTELVVYRFPGGGYCDYTFQVRHAREFGVPVDAEPGGRPTCAPIWRTRPNTPRSIPSCVFDGGDHEEWDQATYSAMFDLRRQGGGRIRHRAHEPGRLSGGSAAAARAHRHGGGRRTARAGPLLRRPAMGHSRRAVAAGLDQADQRAVRVAADAVGRTDGAWRAFWLGREAPQGFLDVAWRWLIKNHPHDSICGCSIDVVHEDMKFRFSQARQIAERLTVEATRSIAASVTGDLADDELRVVVFNPLSAPLDETVEVDATDPDRLADLQRVLWIRAKARVPHLWRRTGRRFRISGWARPRTGARCGCYETKFPEAYRTHDVRVSLPLSIPAVGYTTLTVRADPQGHATRHPATPGLAVDERSMENEFLRVTIESNGTLTLLDKRTGETYAPGADLRGRRGHRRRLVSRPGDQRPDVSSPRRAARRSRWSTTGRN